MSSSPAENGAPVIYTAIEGRFAPTQALVVVVALLLNMLDGFDVTAMAFTAHSIGEELAIPPDQLGIVFSVALAGMMLGAMFIAPASDVVGRRRMILACVASIGVSVLLTGYASSISQLIVLRLITGLGVGGMLASLAALTSEFTPEKYRSLAVMLVTAGYPLGATLGGMVAAPLLANYGWQSVFFAGGAATIAMVVVVALYVPESLQFLAVRRPGGALAQFNRILRRLGHADVDDLPRFVEHGEPAKANVLSLLQGDIWKRTTTLWTTFFFAFICLYFLMSWIPKLVISAGLSETSGVYASVALNGGGVVGIVMLGLFAARLPLTNLIGVFLSTAAIGMLVFALGNGIAQLLLFLVVIGFFLHGGFTGLYAVAAKIYPAEIRTTGVGWAIGLGRFGAVVGPYVGGLLIAGGVSMEVNFVVFAIPLLISGLLSLALAVR
jgi:benzoate transport